MSLTYTRYDYSRRKKRLFIDYLRPGQGYGSIDKRSSYQVLTSVVDRFGRVGEMGSEIGEKTIYSNNFSQCR